jgi:hypothetical protein
MPEAKRVHSTPPASLPISQSNPVDATSRRRFLSQAAGVAAGGAVVALATVFSLGGRYGAYGRPGAL